MNEAIHQRVHMMQRYLHTATEDPYASPSDKLSAVTNLFNYYHSDWGVDAQHFVEKDLKLFDDVAMQQLFSTLNPQHKTPRTIIHQEAKSKYKRSMRPGQD